MAGGGRGLILDPYTKQWVKSDSIRLDVIQLFGGYYGVPAGEVDRHMATVQVGEFTDYVYRNSMIRTKKVPYTPEQAKEIRSLQQKIWRLRKKG